MQKTLRAVAKRLGIETRKAAWYGYRGAPDLLLLGPGRRHGFLEVKREGGELTVLQAREIARLEQAGYWVGVCYGDAEIEPLLAAYLLATEGVPGRRRGAAAP